MVKDASFFLADNKARLAIEARLVRNRKRYNAQQEAAICIQDFKVKNEDLKAEIENERVLIHSLSDRISALVRNSAQWKNGVKSTMTYDVLANACTAEDPAHHNLEANK